jgi:hypothetical protein
LGAISGAAECHSRTKTREIRELRGHGHKPTQNHGFPGYDGCAARMLLSQEKLSWIWFDWVELAWTRFDRFERQYLPPLDAQHDFNLIESLFRLVKP